MTGARQWVYQRHVSIHDSAYMEIKCNYNMVSYKVFHYLKVEKSPGTKHPSSETSAILFVLWLIEWCFMLLSTVFQSYHGVNSYYSCLYWVLPVLGWGSKVSCPWTVPWKNPEAPVQLEPRTPELRVKQFTTEPRRTLPAFVYDDTETMVDWRACLKSTILIDR